MADHDSDYSVKACDILVTVGFIILLILFFALLRPPSNTRSAMYGGSSTCPSRHRVVRIEDPEFQKFYQPVEQPVAKTFPKTRSHAVKYAQLSPWESIPDLEANQELPHVTGISTPDAKRAQVWLKR
jgi:hypothetical protein